MTLYKRFTVPAALLVSLGLLLGPASAHAEDDALRAALAALGEPVAAGRMQPVLMALDDLKKGLEQARVEALVRVLPEPPDAP